MNTQDKHVCDGRVFESLDAARVRANEIYAKTGHIVAIEPYKEKTAVIFRKFHGGDIIALFPYEIWGNHGNGIVTIASYEHVGQHGGASIGLVNTTKPAKPGEYAELASELERIGYNLEIKQRVNYAKYRAAVAA